MPAGGHYSLLPLESHDKESNPMVHEDRLTMMKKVVKHYVQWNTSHFEKINLCKI